MVLNIWSAIYISARNVRWFMDSNLWTIVRKLCNNFNLANTMTHINTKRKKRNLIKMCWSSSKNHYIKKLTNWKLSRREIFYSSTDKNNFPSTFPFTNTRILSTSIPHSRKSSHVTNSKNRFSEAESAWITTWPITPFRKSKASGFHDKINHGDWPWKTRVSPTIRSTRRPDAANKLRRRDFEFRGLIEFDRKILV